ncbi:hypothetical protein C8J57DRAFT_1287779 [Mycena rebaudengoi]|nr:hypothetical protein C8J57DRAFT_1287779 [Mycena rebaudengoi]
MHLKQRLPVEQAPQGKRLPLQEPVDAHLAARQFTLTGPITLTINSPATQTDDDADETNTSASASRTDTTTTSSASPTSSPPISPPTGIPSPIASVINKPGTTSVGEGQSNNRMGGALAKNSPQRGLPTGAIVGITIACVILLLGALVFFIRQRRIRARKERGQTAPWLPNVGQASNSSFEPAQRSFAPQRSANMGETSPGVSFARAQAAALATRAPVSMPQEPSSSYNNTPAPPVAAGGVPSATVRYEFIPTLPDELSITTGENVRVLAEYDDGWALCANLRGEQGMVPLECLELNGAGSAQGSRLSVQQDARNSRRTSSLVPNRY